MTEPILLRSQDGPIARLTLNTPKSLNALSDAMLDALQAAVDDIAADNKTRAVVLAAEGRAFSAGHNLKEMTAARQAPDGGRAAFEALFDKCATFMMSLRAMPQPVIAEVQGLATAAGCQLVASCDMAVASTEAKFGVNGVNIGLFCSTPMVALSRNVTRKKAFEMLTTGSFLSAAEAVEAGLVNRAVPAEDLSRETAALAETVAEKLAVAVRIGKEAFYAQAELPLDAAYELTGKVMAANMMEEDTAEGISAFLGKRPPAWHQD